MKKAFFIVLGLFFSIGAFSQAVIGGAGVCFTNADPNTVTDIQDPNTDDMCRVAMDTVNNKVYFYNNVSDTWDEWTQTGATDLAIANKTATTLDITSSTGTDVTVPAVTQTEAGLMIAGDKVKMDYITVTQAVDLDDMEDDIADIRTLTGTSDEATNLGTFTGSTISDNNTIYGALQELETALEGLPASDTNLFSGDLTQTAARSHTLLDNTANALAFTSTGATNIFSITTTDGSEEVYMGHNLEVLGNVELSNSSGQIDLKGIVITVPNIPSYSSKSAADAALAAGALWKTNSANVHGLPAGVLLVAN